MTSTAVALVLLFSLSFFGTCELRRCSAQHIGYVPRQKACLSATLAVNRFCRSSHLSRNSLKCIEKSSNAFVLEIPCQKSGAAKPIQEAERLAVDVRVRVGCDFLFYEARNVVLDADGFRQSPNSFRLQPTVPFHLDRIDQPALPVNGEFVWNATGQSVTVFILDSGILKEHAEFRRGKQNEHRVFFSAPRSQQQTRDCLEHGTQVASVVAGNLLGVAKEATLIDVAALRCPRTKKSANPTLSILAGLRFVEENAADSLPAILLLPFHLDGIDPGVEDMISRVYEKGIFVVASAGDKAGSCACTPARMRSVLSVGATDTRDRVLYHNDRQSCINVCAPGTKVTVASARTKNATRSVEGTAFSAAEVAGVAATILEKKPDLTPVQLREHILQNYTTFIGKENPPLIQSLSSEDREKIATGQLVVTRTLTTPLPGLVVHPTRVPIIHLFKNTAESSKKLVLRISNYRKGELSWHVHFRSIHEDDPLEWMIAERTGGTLLTGKNTRLTIRLTSEFDKPCLKQGFIRIHSNDPTFYELQIPIEVVIHCERMFVQRSRYEMSIENVTFSDRRPTSWDPPTLEEKSDLLYMEALLRLSTSVANSDVSEVNADSPSNLEDIILLNDEPCGEYLVRMTHPKLSEWEGENVLCLSIEDNTVYDIEGKPFPGQRTCITYDVKPRSRFYGTFLSVGHSTAPLTTDSDVLLALAFSERVEGFHDGLVKVSKGKVISVSSMQPTKTLYFIQIRLPKDYFGFVTVSLSKEGIVDTTGNELVKETSLTFERVRHVAVRPAAVQF